MLRLRAGAGTAGGSELVKLRLGVARQAVGGKARQEIFKLRRRFGAAAAMQQRICLAI